MLQPCTGQCPAGRKPKLTTSCQRCVDWAINIEAALYPPVLPPAQPQITWQNIDVSNLGMSHVEVAKAYVLRLPKHKGNPGAAHYTQISDFDTASVLMIMAKFGGFHGADKASYDKIMKVVDIRNELSHLRLQKNMRFDDQKVKQYFRDLEDLVTCLEQLHPQHFPQDVIAKLHTIQMEVVTGKMMNEIHLELQEEVANLKEVISKHTDENANLTGCRNQLKADYKANRGGIGFLPEMPKEFSLQEFFVDLSLVQEEKRPTHVKMKELNKYTDLLTLENENESHLKHILVRGEAGTGKSTMLSKLAFQWATNEEEGESDNLLSRFELVFVLDIRKFQLNMNLIDCIRDQLLHDMSESALKSMLVSKADKCLFLFDGYDELKSTHQEVLISKLLLQGHVIVTTRPDKVDEFCHHYHGYVHVKLTGFSEESRNTFVSKYFEENKEKAEALVTKIKSSYLNFLSFFPLLLAMICTVFHYQGNTPSRMTNLYEEVVEVFAMQFYMKSYLSSFPWLVITRNVSPTKQTKQEIWSNKIHSPLGSAALKGLLEENNKLIFDRSDFRQRHTKWIESTPIDIKIVLIVLVCAYFVGVGFVENNVSLWVGPGALMILVSLILTQINHKLDVTESAQKLGMLTTVIGNRTKMHGHGFQQYSFLHKSFQEFFAAKYWASLATAKRERFDYYLDFITKDNIWSMLYLLKFCCGSSKEATEIILRRLVSVKDSWKLDWRIPVTLLFESEIDQTISPFLHRILEPIKSLELGMDMTDRPDSELWTILLEYLHLEEPHHQPLWLHSIEELKIVASGVLQAKYTNEHAIVLQFLEALATFTEPGIYSLRVFKFYGMSVSGQISAAVAEVLLKQINLKHIELSSANIEDENGSIQTILRNMKNCRLWGTVLLDYLLTVPYKGEFFFHRLLPDMVCLSLDHMHLQMNQWITLADTFILIGKRESANGRKLQMRHLTLTDDHLFLWRDEDGNPGLLEKLAEMLSFMLDLESLKIGSHSCWSQTPLKILGPVISNMSNIQNLYMGRNVKVVQYPFKRVEFQPLAKVGPSMDEVEDFLLTYNTSEELAIIEHNQRKYTSGT